MDTADLAGSLLALERAAMNRWAEGDPDGFLDLSWPDLSYFDPFQAKRLDGIDALRTLYETLRGKVRIDEWTMIDPRVQAAGGAAVLTYRFQSRGSEGAMMWNCTEVYEKRECEWKIIHSHWSQPREA